MRKQLNMQVLEEFLTKEIEPEALSATLEEVLWRYVGMLLSGADGNVPCQADADQVYDLRRLKEVLVEVTGSAGS